MTRIRIAAVLGERPRLGHVWCRQEGANDVAFSPDGRWVPTARGDHTARIWGRCDGGAPFRRSGESAPQFRAEAQPGTPGATRHCSSTVGWSSRLKERQPPGAA